MRQAAIALSVFLGAAAMSWADEPAAAPAAEPTPENAVAPAEPPPKQLSEAPSAPPTEPSADDEAAIRASAEAYVAAYNSHDAAALAQFWADDAVYLNRESGAPVVGRAAIGAMFQEMFEAGEADKLTVDVESVRLVTSDVAIEDGAAELITPDGQPLLSTYTAVHVKKDGRWYITTVRETDLPGPTTGETEQTRGLEQLAWLVGKWVDQDEQSTIRTTCDWAKNGKFLTSNFEVSIGDAVTLEGTQIIGWDPVSQSIRSWMFDSEGGFGEGRWHRSGDEWTVETKATQADGSQASATNVYRILDEGSFGWRSANRQVDGEALPNIEEVPVYRQ